MSDAAPARFRPPATEPPWVRILLIALAAAS